MQKLFIGALALAVLFVMGCSSVPTQVNKSPIRAATFAFVGIKSKSADFAEKREPIHAIIQESISTTLSGKGLSRVAANGDVTVAYLIIVGNNATTAAVNDYFGYGRDDSALHEKAFKAYGRSKNPNYFEAGTLLIDIVDSQTGALLYRNHVTRPLLKDLPDDARAARIQEAVNEALQGLQATQ